MFVLIVFLARKRIKWSVGGLGLGFFIMSAIVEGRPGWCRFFVHEFEPEATDHYENDDIETDISVRVISLLRSS